jgi:ligand-binding sensor domain-containing protein
MKRLLKLFLHSNPRFVLALILAAGTVSGQTNIPVGTWRYHLSFHDTRTLTSGNNKIFAANESGVVVFDRADQSIITYNKLNGLSNTGISYLNYDESTGQLLIAYEDGDLDILRDQVITNFTSLKTAALSVEKKINHIAINGGVAFLSTNYGVVLFDLTLLEIKETWRDLGATGEALAINQSTISGDSIFLATANGVLAGDLDDNLLDYQNWKRYNTGNFAGPIRSITTFQDHIFATGATGVYEYELGHWTLKVFLQDKIIQSLRGSGDDLFLIADSTIWSFNTSDPLAQIADDLITSPSMALQDDDGTVWVADRRAGLVSNVEGTFASFIPNGPTVSQIFRMVFNDGKLFVVSGGFSSSGQPLKKSGDLNIFENGSWSTVRESTPDLTDVAWVDGNVFISTFGSGLLMKSGESVATLWDESNSPLINLNSQNSTITAIEPASGLWVANYGGIPSLHRLKEDQTWDSFAFNYPNAENPADLSIDGRGNVWMRLQPSEGGGLIAFQPVENLSYNKTTSTGTGALPDKAVNCMTVDREGYMWVGTNTGVAYFLSAKDDAISPIFEGQFLLRSEKITAIDVDGGNRKWIGTEQGVWLFSPTGEGLIHNFTADNSPLLSNNILDIEINDTSGEVFFATDRGIVSYQSDASSAGPAFENSIRIFPNPVTSAFTGAVGISGLANDAFVKITDVTGRLLWESRANGGMVSWNVRDQTGKRAATGVYLIFAATADGTESMVGKIAVIN